MSWTRERWNEVESVFLDAAREAVADRPAFLAAACGDDLELRRAVERLLGADAVADDLLDQGAIGALRGPDPLLQQRCGPFRLIERIAEGGMGTVYRAAREGGDFAQPAAVKLLRLGLSTERMRDRFARERQTLARLLHANVARLLDGGTTAQGVPFFAMELIDGLPIDRWCDERRASLRQRLELFVTVCRAVHFAHQNLVVHLDLKPGNILVDTHGVPKLVDFGVAGLLRDAAAGEVEATQGRPLTPEYASPELRRGEAVSTAADVWSLGVVLCELIAGVRPFGAATDAEREPSRPSTAVLAAAPVGAADERAARRGIASVLALSRRLRGDLDRIVGKALRREPAARYASCQEFADDVERHLRGFPVAARDPGLGYRCAKFVRRNRAAVAAAAVAVIALVVGLVATLQMAAIARTEADAADAARRRAEREMAHARIEAASSREVAAFLGETFLTADAIGGEAGRAQLAATVRRRAEQVRRLHQGDAHLRANVLDALGRTAIECAAYDVARELIDEAMATRRAEFGAESLEYALSLASLGRLHHREGRFDAAATVLAECLRLHRVSAPDVHSDVAAAANDLAAAERALGHRERARELHQEALSLRRQAGGGDSTLVAESLNNLANAEDDPATAQRWLEEALAIRTRVLGEDDPLTMQSRINLARVALARRDVAVALPMLRAAVAAGRRLGGLGEEPLAQALGSLAMAELSAGDAAAALLAIEEALRRDRARHGDQHPQVAKDYELLAAVQLRRGEPAAAVAAAREVVRIHLAQGAAGAPASALCTLGRYQVAAGDAAGALATLDAASDLHRRGTPRPVDVADVQRNRADALEALQRLDEAEQALLQVLAVYTAEPSRSWAVGGVRARLRAIYGKLGRPDDAARYADPAK